jgi:hypothetical protein
MAIKTLSEIIIVKASAVPFNQKKAAGDTN